MEKKKVLIVEDEILIQEIIQLHLQLLGYEVCGKVATSSDAIAIAAETKPDIILMDINLNEQINGIETARVIKESSNPKIIFLSALSDKEVVDQAKDVHPNGYILKPFSNKDLRVALTLAK